MKRFCLTFCLLTFFITSTAAQINIQVKNSSFEERGKGWKAFGSGKVVFDSEAANKGDLSISIEHPDWMKTKVESEEVSLKVGHVYKLSGWAKTESVVSSNYEQYPTPVAACITMESFPFTNNSTAIGSTNGWKKLEIMFTALKSKDKVCLNLGYNGNAKGKVWFDDIQLEEVTDISQYIPVETIRWYGNGFRYEDKGWIFVHIEGKPYQRGYQYGFLLAEEIKTFIEKLAVTENAADPASAWKQIRFGTDAMFLRKYDEEYLTEMKGIADGAAKAGVKVFDRTVDFLDIAAINSSIDLDYAKSALSVTPNPLTGKSFLANEDELNLPERLHKCSAFLANNSATKDGKIVFGQIFMWGGYTGYNWNVIVDVVPSDGNRLVYQTFPGGIHSGADFYINSAGIMIGETTVQQTPFNVNGTPQSNRIRKAAQYANSVDDVAEIMTANNNGMYTNDWLIGDVKQNEIAILLLGTNKWKLWRSSKQDWYNEAKDFYWSNNNNKDLEVRKEYITNADDAPVDIVFRPVNRDLAFWNFYQQKKGGIDYQAGIELWNSSPVNRPHACDGKITTSEMAEQMVFLLHSGKVTLREKMVGENGRMPDLQNAVPRLTLGYTAASPIYFADKIKELKSKYAEQKKSTALLSNYNEVKEIYSFDKESLWKGTVYPASEKENWFVSGTAAYYNMLKQIPADAERAFNYIKDELTELNYRLLYINSKEGSVAPLNAKIVYDKYNNYQMPRIKATYMLHQLRLMLGSKTFSVVMKKIHQQYREKNIKTEEILSLIDNLGGIEAKEYVLQWLNREDIPQVSVSSSVELSSDDYKVKLNIAQNGNPYKFFTTVAVDFAKERIVKKVEVNEASQTIELTFKEKPLKVTFNYGNDIPVARKNFYTYQNMFDDFANLLIVYGTNQQIEANHTIALRYQKVIADRFTEVFSPIKKDAEVCPEELSKKDLVILGSPTENSLAKTICGKLGIETGKYFFKWMGTTYNYNDDGLYLTMPNPFNEKKTVYLFLANSAQELYQMTKRHTPAPAWALFKGDKIVKRGYHSVNEYEISLE